jgi:hypothetical protein
MDNIHKTLYTQLLQSLTQLLVFNANIPKTEIENIVNNVIENHGTDKNTQNK